MNELTKGDLIIYEDENDKIEIEAFLYDETIWLPLNKIAELFEKNKMTISEHIKNIYNEGELDKTSTIRNFLTVQNEGNRNVSRDVVHYNLQMIISLGFKVDNERAVQFRKWANLIVKEYTIKGFAMDNERLKNR